MSSRLFSNEAALAFLNLPSMKSRAIFQKLGSDVESTSETLFTSSNIAFHTSEPAPCAARVEGQRCLLQVKAASHNTASAAGLSNARMHASRDNAIFWGWDESSGSFIISSGVTDQLGGGLEVSSRTNR